MIIIKKCSFRIPPRRNEMVYVIVSHDKVGQVEPPPPISTPTLRSITTAPVRFLIADYQRDGGRKPVLLTFDNKLHALDIAQRSKGYDDRVVYAYPFTVIEVGWLSINRLCMDMVVVYKVEEEESDDHWSLFYGHKGSSVFN